MKGAGGVYSPMQASGLLKSWFMEDGKSAALWEDDREVLGWMADHQVRTHKTMNPSLPSVEDAAAKR